MEMDSTGLHAVGFFPGDGEYVIRHTAVRSMMFVVLLPHRDPFVNRAVHVDRRRVRFRQQLLARGDAGDGAEVVALGLGEGLARGLVGRDVRVRVLLPRRLGVRRLCTPGAEWAPVCRRRCGR